MVEQIAAQRAHRIDCDVQHQLGVDDRHRCGKQVGDRHENNVTDDDRHGGVFVHVALDDHLLKCVVDRLHQQRGNGTDGGGQNHTDRNDDQSALVDGDVRDQALGRLFDVFGLVLFFLFLFFQLFGRQFLHRTRTARSAALCLFLLVV